MLVKLYACIGPLALAVDDLGVNGVSFVDILILYERWAGERLVLEKTVPKPHRADRPISVSAVPPAPSIDIWRSCRFLGACLPDLVASCLVDWVLTTVDFDPMVGSTVVTVLQLSVWRPLKLAFLDDLLFLPGYRRASGESLLAGTLRMRNCSLNFSTRKPTWGLPADGCVAALVRCARWCCLMWVSPRGLADFARLQAYCTFLRRRRSTCSAGLCTW